MTQRLNPPRGYIAFRLDPALREQVIRTADVLQTSKGDIMERCIRTALPTLISATLAQIAADNARAVSTQE